MKTQIGAKDILFPVPPALIVTGLEDNRNIITIAWIGIVGSKPPAIGISLHKSRYSLSLLRQTGEFTVNIPSKSDYIKVDYCGITSGKKRNKFKDTGFTKIDGTKVKVPIIKECPLNIECKIIKELDMSDWILIIGEILEINIDSDKINPDGKVSVEKVNPLIYVPTIREYWSIGQKLGNSFDVGRNYNQTSQSTNK
ncbi:MAG: flavin reductase family protein [Methanobacteriaceae archaeon]|nr:flavin reductase family protein [Candidatus Methanorudis spinitermitis]